MHQRLVMLLEQHKILFSQRFGFRKDLSTNYALIGLTETVRNALGNNNYACGVFVDRKKAFNTADHEILFRKLEHYGIHSVAMKLFSSYLTGCKQ